MPETRSIRLRWAVLAMPALALVPALAQDSAEHAPDAPVTDVGVSTGFELRAASAQWSIGDPTGDEQQLLELMNRARMNPIAEGDRIFVDYGSERVTQAVNFFLKQRPSVEYTRAENRDAFHGYPAQPPFAMNGHLIDSARGHSQKMKDFDSQSHQVPGELGLRDRIVAAGYLGTSLAENVFAFANDMVHAHAGFAIDYGQDVLPGHTRPELGHRVTLMGFDGDPARKYVETGVGVIDDNSGGTQVGPKLVTIDFGIPASGPASFVTGVCWEDKNHSGFYDPGEGIAGVRIDLDVGDTFAISSASGGYAIPVDGAPGTVHVTATGTPSTPGAMIGTQMIPVNMTGFNVKVDFTRPPDPPMPPVLEFSFAGSQSFDDSGAALPTIDIAAQDGLSTLVGDLQCEVGIDHAARDEFKATLISPSGTEVVLFDHGPGGSGLSGTFPISLSPQGPLDACIGETFVGTWKLRLEDTVPGNSGNLTDWKLRIRPQWVRTLFSPASPLFVTKLTVKDSKKPLGDSVTLNAQVDTRGVPLDATAPCELRLLSADAARTELLSVAIPAKSIKYAVKGTSRTTIAAKVAKIDIPAPLPANVYVESSIGGAIVGESVTLAKGTFNGATKLPASPLFHVDSMTTKIVSRVPNYTLTGRFAGAADAIAPGLLEISLGAATFTESISASQAASTTLSLKRTSGMKKLVIDARKGTFLVTIATPQMVLQNGTVALSLRLGDTGLFGGDLDHSDGERHIAEVLSFRLGTGASKSTKRDLLRGGELSFESSRGLRRETALLIEALPKRFSSRDGGGGRALFGLDTEGAPALAARSIWPDAAVTWFHFDAYVGAKVKGVLAHNDDTRVAVVVDEDLPPGPFDLVALPFPRNSEALLMRDLLEAAHDRLAVGGRLVAATEGKSTALGRAVEKVFGNVTPAAPRGIRGACFYAERKRERPAQSDHSHVVRGTFVHADGSGETSIDVETRPGTFSHAAIDKGSRALAEWLEPRKATHVLDLGAGCGVIGLCVAKRIPEARVVLVDSNARAAGCARRNAERNAVADRVEVLVRADLEDIHVPGRGGFDLCVTNPPYFSQWRIATSFVRNAHTLLRRGGRFALVVKAGKAAAEHAKIVEGVFGGAAVDERDGYGIVHASS